MCGWVLDTGKGNKIILRPKNIADKKKARQHTNPLNDVMYSRRKIQIGKKRNYPWNKSYVNLNHRYL